MAERKVFQSRKKSWAERQNASRNSRTTIVEHGSAFCDDKEQDIDLDHAQSEPLMEETVKKYMDSLTTCPKCKNDDPKNICDKNIDGENGIWLKFCKKCEETFGADDSCSVYDLQEKVKQWSVKLCACGNDNVENYKVLGHDSNGLRLLCNLCNKEFVLGKSGHNDAPVSGEVPAILACKCGNNSMNELECYQHEDSDMIIGMKCLRCDNSWLLDDSNDYSDDVTEYRLSDQRGVVVDSEVIKASYPVGREEVNSAWDVHEADHIAWWKPLGYWHHALVEHVYPETSELDVIHYNGPSPTGQFVKGQIVKEKIDLRKESGLLYRLKYDGPCFERDTTMIRAESRMEEVQYNLFTNNCEHFVRWCKTGFDCSIQVKNFCETLNRIGKKVTSCFSKEVSKKGIGALATRALGRAALGEMAAVASEGSLASVTGKYLCECIGVGAIVAIEGISMGRDIYKAHNLKKEGHISHQEFLNITVRRSSEGVLGSVGAVAGGYLGALIPIPVVGTIIGCTLGALLGHGLGHMAGYLYASNQRKSKIE